jgi:hypothetical protein
MTIHARHLESLFIDSVYLGHVAETFVLPCDLIRGILVHFFIFFVCADILICSINPNTHIQSNIIIIIQEYVHTQLPQAHQTPTSCLPFLFSNNVRSGKSPAIPWVIPRVVHAYPE